MASNRHPLFQQTPWTNHGVVAGVTNSHSGLGGDSHVPHSTENQLILPIAKTRIRGHAMRQPREITCFSLDNKRDIHLDESSLSYFYLRAEDLTAAGGPGGGGVSLSTGFEQFQKRDDNIDEHLDGLLLALVDTERKDPKRRKTTGDIVTWRGMLTKLLCLPYSKNDGFEMNAMAFDGQLFIEENLPYKVATQRKQDQRGQMMTYWGYKFEQIATIPHQWSECTREEIETRTSRPVNNNAQYCSVVKTGLGDVRLIIAGEVDCVYDYKPQKFTMEGEVVGEDDDPFDNPLDHYVELKTNKVIQSDRDAMAFENKLFKVWAQSFLLGVPRVIVGFRTEQGYLQTFETFQTHKIPSTVKKSKFANSYTTWDGVDALAFLAACLQWLKTNILAPAQAAQKAAGNEEEDITKAVVWRIRYLPRSDYLILSRTELPSFLHPDFVEWRRERRTQR
ncbi:RAI1 like PD-XK nuclease-domain-containing protein [Limtongia smithiae]|uniref:RAI1 like PD-XK nuclease-domain-containing protein n=1 Tax=Limtongia smithiae TaxID=1125753 RepID=UPI0034CD3112